MAVLENKKYIGNNLKLGNNKKDMCKIEPTYSPETQDETGVCSLPRTFRNEMVQLAPPILIYFFGEDFYRGKEQVLGFGFSYIVPKASPLRVSPKS